MKTRTYQNNKKQIYTILTKILKRTIVLILLVAGCIGFCDIQGYFEANNGRLAKVWDSFYQFSAQYPIDILLVGNSHMYKSIQPSQLNANLGCYAFSITAPGIHIGETYFCLKEAVQQCKPTLVVVETCGITDFNPYDLTPLALSCQYSSFAKRRNIWDKIYSTPLLFTPFNYGYAWSNTLRNHHFLFKNRQQIEQNFFKQTDLSSTTFYFGGDRVGAKKMTDSTLHLYDSLPAPIDGADYQYSDYAKKYVQKIIRLCKEEQIKLVFLTAPVYYKHVDNYEAWKEKLGELLLEKPWLDLQYAYDYEAFTPNCFENIFEPNQHLTLDGAKIATEKLTQFIQNQLNIDLPTRKQDSLWQQLYQEN